MKQWITILLLLVVGFATFEPCYLFDNCAVEEVSTSAESHHEGDEKGTCSPFASCTACTGFTIEVAFVQLQAPIIKLPEYQTYKGNNKLPTSFSSLWQPPWAS